VNHLTGEQIAAHLLGEEDATEHLGGCTECRNKLDATSNALLDALPTDPVAPLALEPAARFWPFVARLEILWDLSNAGVKDVLAKAAHPDSWLDFFGGCKVFHLKGGPKTAGADVGLMEIPAGGVFPRHSHQGPESVLILQGGYADSATGKTVCAGETDLQPGRADHELKALPNGPCVYAVVGHGIDFVVD